MIESLLALLNRKKTDFELKTFFHKAQNDECFVDSYLTRTECS